MPNLTPAEAAERLGIADEHYDAFIALATAMRTPAAQETELLRLRTELAAVNDELHKAGIDHPTGARGVRDLRGFYERATDTEE